MTKKIQIAIFASGKGSNFRAIQEVLRNDQSIPGQIRICISNNSKPGAFEYAAEQGIETLRLSPKMFEDEKEYEQELLAVLRTREIDLIVLAGYMRKLPPGVVQKYRGRILNIHPALLPEFGGKGMYGMYVHEAVLTAGKRISGATVHLADEEYDTGPIIAQQTLEIAEDDTPETLAAKVLAVEHELYPRVVSYCLRKLLNGEQLAEGR